jgi:hypothetical protein
MIDGFQSEDDLSRTGGFKLLGWFGVAGRRAKSRRHFETPVAGHSLKRINTHKAFAVRLKKRINAHKAFAVRLKCAASPAP